MAQRSAKSGTAGSVLTWLFTNLEGTVDVQTTANGSSTVQSYRDPFGAPITGTGQAWADGSGYMNKQVAQATGLTNVGARTYDPVLGKFVSVDPVIDTNLPQQNTGYAYSGNNPTTYTDPTGLAMKIDCGCGKTTPYAAPPRLRSSQRFGTQLTSFATSLIKTSGESDKTARATAYATQNAGSFFMSEQGALIRAWMSGNLPGIIEFGEESRITQGLRDTDHMRRYQERVYLALSQSSNIPDPVNYDAESYSLKNPNTLQDLFTFGNWEDASDSQRSLAVIGSYQVAPPQVSMTSANSADVTYRLENDITVGSLISFSDQLRQFGYSVASDSGPLSTVHTSFTWTESYSW